MGIKSYNNGKKFENDLADYLSEKGYYVIYNEKGVTGSQCCDLVIVKNNEACMIECKNLENKNGKFNLDRVEVNQLFAYKRYKECNNDYMFLAILWNNNVYFIDFGLLQYFSKSIDLTKIDASIKDFYKE